MAKRFRAEGGMLEPVRITGFDIVDGTVRRLRTDGDRRPVSAVVLAAGVEAGELGAQLGAILPLARERGYHAMLARGALSLDLPVSFAERGFVATPMDAGTRLAGTVELGTGPRPDWRRAAILLRHARDLFGVEAPASGNPWFGDRPTLPDYLPVIGAAPKARNAFIATGHQHLGLTLAAATARQIAALATGRPPSLDLAPFNATRFGLC
jgi:D-amino-acid dehydrogenase